jgi:hypothetical protein
VHKFELLGDDGHSATAGHPAGLAEFAFDRGAQTVKHDYDLREAEIALRLHRLGVQRGD